MTIHTINHAYTGGLKSDADSEIVRLPLAEITPQDIDLINRCFSIKTIFDVELGCHEEARQVLQASLTDLPIRHALSSLRALREHLETPGDIAASVAHQTSTQDYGLQQYCMALRGLACNLASPGVNELKSALLCCQIFISIEQVRANYATMAQHIVQGLRIMHEYRARPNFGVGDEFVPGSREQLPLLDVFVIKLFAGPCKFAETPATFDSSEITASICPLSPGQPPLESHQPRTIAPEMRTELTRFAASTLAFLEKVSHVDSAENALRLLSEKMSLLGSLETWLVDLEIIHMEVGPPGHEPLSVSFMRLFYHVLKIILLGTLDSSPDLDAKLRAEKEQLQAISSNVDKRAKAYWKRSGTGGGRGEKCKVT